MKKAKCRLVCVGIESGNQQVLNNVKKGTKVEKIEHFFKDAHKSGMLVHGCFMMGNKGETKRTIRSHRVRQAPGPGHGAVLPHHGVPWHRGIPMGGGQRISHDDRLRPVGGQNGQHNTLVSTEHISAEELVLACHQARREYYFRPSFVFQKMGQFVTHPTERARILKASKTFFKYCFDYSKNIFSPEAQIVPKAAKA